MEDTIVFHPQLTKADALILEGLRQDVKDSSSSNAETSTSTPIARDEELLRHLQAMNDPQDAHFEPSVTTNWDIDQIKLPLFLEKTVLRPYIRLARSVVRVETDVIMLTHLLLYFSTTIPSAIFLGVLDKKFAVFDHLFPYILDPLMGHTWNSYFYHHVKHHHVEGNGPNDLSSTIRYQRDSLPHFLHYVGRFFFLVMTGLKAGFWEFSNYAFLITMFSLHRNATICVFLMPLLLLRLGLMAGNWAQHAFVDDVDPDSDYRSSITLIDVASNRFCYNDGYHTSHHLNPLRHWREHPVSFQKTKHTYASQHALVFHDIDYMMVTVRLMMKDYKTLARCLVPMGEQIAMSLDERAAMLETKTRRFTEEEIQKKFKK
ncbi:hypothetical protein LB503_009939 [Fusarium chuoi]|nr:hypothetical protein LB503_009939 [Fusarium chuoi]